MGSSQINLGQRVWSATPPLQTIERFCDDISIFDDVTSLLGKASGQIPATFPFEQELSAFLLLTKSIWPSDRKRLLEAARIFCGAVNYLIGSHCATLRSKLPSSAETDYTLKNLESFNQKFFDRIGGKLSLLASSSAASFHREMWSRVNELLTVHDVIEFMTKARALSPELGTQTLAYHAIANNVFERKGGYGIAKGLKRHEYATTVNTVRAKCRKDLKQAVLSYVVTRYSSMHYFNAFHPLFLVILSKAREASFETLFAHVSTQLASNTSPQNDPNKLQLSSMLARKIIRQETLTPAQLTRALELSDKVRKRPIEASQKDEMMRRCKDMVSVNIISKASSVSGTHTEWNAPSLPQLPYARNSR